MKSRSESSRKTGSGDATSASLKAEVEALRRKAAELGLRHPEKAAKILADWINRGAFANIHKKAG